MDSIEMNRRLESLWQQAADNITASSDVHSLLDGSSLDGGGHLKISGSSELAESWLRHQIQARDGRVVRLDLDGWEPGGQDLDPYLTYQSAVWDLSQPADSRGTGAEDAGRLSLELCSIQDSSSTSSNGADLQAGQPSLAQALNDLRQSGVVVILVPSADTLPENVRQTLAQACTPGSGLIWAGVFSSSADSADLHAGLHDGLQSQISELSAHLDEILGDPDLRHALAHWALLLGESASSAPLEPVLAALGLDDDTREHLIDRVDDDLVEGEATELLRDLQFLHPSFSEAVYRPAHPLWGPILLHGLSDDQKRDMSARLLTELRRRLRPARGSFSLLLRLAERAGDVEVASRLRLRLHWWSDSAHLDDVINRALDAGSLSANELWTLAGEALWPPNHRLSFINAWSRISGATAHSGDAEMLRAEILHKAEQLPEALDAVRKALEIQGLNHTPRSKPYLAALHLCALLLMEVGELEVGLEQMELCVELAAHLLTEDDPKRAMILENQGKALIRGGRLRQARGAFEEALRMTSESRGENHPATAIQRNNLAGLLIEIGELEQARQQLELASGVLESSFGSRSMELYGSLRNLVQVTDEMRDDERALELLERLAPLEESLLGSSHPGLLSTWTRLAEMRRDHGDRDGARFLFERALELAVEIFYGDHPSIPTLQAALSDLE